MKLILIFIVFGSTVIGQNLTTNLFENTLDSKDSCIRLFVIGESHYDKDEEIELRFLKYLNYKFGVTRLGIEMEVGTEVFINKYLESGDEKFLHILHKYYFRRLKRNSFIIARQIRLLNLSLPIERRIKIFAFDVSLIAPKRDRMKAIVDSNFNDIPVFKKSEFNSTLQELNSFSDKKTTQETVKKLKTIFDVDSIFYQNILAEKYEMLETILGSSLKVGD